MSTLALTACGGANESDGANPPNADTSSGPPETPAGNDQFLSAGIVGYEVTIPTTIPNAPTIWDTSVYAVADPANRQLQQSFRTYIWNTRLVPALRYDANSGNVTVLGTSKAIQLKNGELFQVDLSRGGDTTPRRLSKLDKICEITNIFPANWSAQDGWVAVSIAPSGNCNAFTSQGLPDVSARQTHYISFKASTDDPGRQLPEGQQIFVSAPSAAPDGRWSFLAIPTSTAPETDDTLVFYDADLTTVQRTLKSPSSRVRWTELFEMGNVSDQLAELFIQATSGYVDTWQISAERETFFLDWETPGNDAAYSIKRITGSTTTDFAKIKPTNGGGIELKAITPTHLLVQERPNTDEVNYERGILWAFPKDGGQPVALNEEPSSPVGGRLVSDWSTRFLGYDDLHAYYEIKMRMNSSPSDLGRFNSVANVIYRARLSDGVKTRIGGNTLKAPIPLTDRQRSMRVPPLRGLAWTEFSDDSTDLVGTLRTFDTASGTTRDLGQFNTLNSDWSWNILGSPDGNSYYWDPLLSIATIEYDAYPTRSRIRHYTAKPDAANSLMEVLQ